MRAKPAFSCVMVLGTLLAVSVAYGGEWTAKTFTPKYINRPYWKMRHVRSEEKGVVRECPEKANLDVEWVINLSQPDDGTLDHVNSDRYYSSYVVGRDTPGCFVSQKFGDHHEDWDYIVAWRDKVWADTGISTDALLWDKVAAIAEAASATFRDHLDKSVKKEDVLVGEHPVDGIIKGTWCAGEANLMIAVASTMGLEGRSITMADHTFCEIRIDGKWRYVENIDAARPHCLSPKSFIEFLEDPDCDPEMPPRIGAFWQKRRNARFAYGPGVGRYWQFMQQGSLYEVWLNSENAHALYPSLTHIPTAMATSRESLNGTRQSLEEWVLELSRVAPLKVGQDSGVRKCFYLSRVPESLSSELFLDATQTQDFPSDGGDWVLQVNGNEYPIRTLEGFRLDSDKMTIPLPVSSLRANVANVVAIRCKSSGDECFCPKLYYDFLLPAATFYYDPASAPPPTVSAIVPPAFRAQRPQTGTAP